MNRSKIIYISKSIKDTNMMINVGIDEEKKIRSYISKGNLRRLTACALEDELIDQVNTKKYKFQHWHYHKPLTLIVRPLNYDVIINREDNSLFNNYFYKISDKNINQTIHEIESEWINSLNITKDIKIRLDKTKIFLELYQMILKLENSTIEADYVLLYRDINELSDFIDNHIKIYHGFLIGIALLIKYTERYIFGIILTLILGIGILSLYSWEYYKRDNPALEWVYPTMIQKKVWKDKIYRKLKTYLQKYPFKASAKENITKQEYEWIKQKQAVINAHYLHQKSHLAGRWLPELNHLLNTLPNLTNTNIGIKALELSNNINALTLTCGDKSLVYEHGPSKVIDMPVFTPKGCELRLIDSLKRIHIIKKNDPWWLLKWCHQSICKLSIPPYYAKFNTKQALVWASINKIGDRFE